MVLWRLNSNSFEMSKRPEPITDPALIAELLRFIRTWRESGFIERKVHDRLNHLVGLKKTQYWHYWKEEEAKRPLVDRRPKVIKVCYLCGSRFKRQKRGKVTDWRGRLRDAHILCIRLAPFFY
jgi:hypothetical protein